MIKDCSFSLGQNGLLKLPRTGRQRELASDQINTIENVNENDSYYTYVCEKNKPWLPKVKEGSTKELATSAERSCSNNGSATDLHPQ
jgi:hypothetical protein